MEGLGWSITVFDQADDETVKMMLQGAKMGISGSKEGELLQFYFYPSDREAQTSKTNVWNPMAKELSKPKEEGGFGPMSAKREGHVIYIGPDQMIAEFEAAK